MAFEAALAKPDIEVEQCGRQALQPLADLAVVNRIRGLRREHHGLVRSLVDVPRVDRKRRRPGVVAVARIIGLRRSKPAVVERVSEQLVALLTRKDGVAIGGERPIRLAASEEDQTVGVEPEQREFVEPPVLPAEAALRSDLEVYRGDFEAAGEFGHWRRSARRVRRVQIRWRKGGGHF